MKDLFNHLIDEHNLTLLESEMEEIEKIIEKNKWISILEQFPDFNVKVLVCEEGNIDSVNVCKLIKISNEKELNSDKIFTEWKIEGEFSEYDYCNEITHWQSLPNTLFK